MDETSDGANGNARKTRLRPVTPEWLFRAAAHYLERYASSTEHLRRILERKAERRRRADPAAGEETDEAALRETHRRLIDETIARFVELKLLDDRAYAEARFSSLRRRGTSLRQTEAKLGQKGVSREMVETLAAGDETGDAAAARAYAKRRRLGVHRLRERVERRDRDIAALMRAGFSYRDAKDAIDAEEGDPAPDG